MEAHSQSSGLFRRSSVADADMWPSLAIAVVWLAVLLDAVFGPEIVSSNGVAGIGQETHIPSAVVVAFFAWLATWVIARNGFHRRQD